MSTEGSVSTTSSGIRQFGLYRSIDARTEEFLRLSRKRQIRQGCACAAISTAITVAVVISIILIYEYSISYESNTKTSLKQNWLSLMNKSAEAIPFEANLNKVKINLDPLYSEFIPIILKTLKNNKYFDEIVEDQSTQSSFDKEEKPKDLYTKNIFSDSRNWMRIPTPRLYTIEYKTSPIVFFKYPTRDIDYFTKIRKIRDYQRIMNYVDKMINDKGTFTSTVPMLKNAYRFHKKFTPIILKTTTPMTKDIESKEQSEHKKVKFHKNASTSKSTKFNKCPCPKRLSLLLIKLIRSLQKIIPDFIGSEQVNACNENELKTRKFATQQLEHESSTVKFEETSTIHEANEILNIIASNYNNNDIKITYNNSEVVLPATNALQFPKIQLTSNSNNDQTMMPNTISKTIYSVKPLYSNIGDTVSSMNGLIKQNFNKIQEDAKNTPLTARQFIEETDANYYFPERTTKPMSKTATTTTQASLNMFTVKDFILKTRKFNYQAKSFPKFGGTKHEDMTPDVVNNFRVLDVHSVELARNNMLLIKNRRESNKTESQIDALKKYKSHESNHHSEKDDNNTWSVLRKLGKLTFSTTMFENSTQRPNWTLIDRAETVTEKDHADFKSETMSSQNLLQSYLSEIQLEQQIKADDVTLEEEIDQASSDEIIPEDNLKRLENFISKINISQIYNRTLENKSVKETSKLDQHGHSQTGKHINNSFKEAITIIPNNRRTYLEIQRNDWKSEDEHQEYDNTL